MTRVGVLGRQLRTAGARPTTLLAAGAFGYLIGVLGRHPGKTGTGGVERKVWQAILWLLALRRS